jgi:hypothetical protein
MPNQPIRAILIDPYTLTVDEIDFIPELRNYQALVGCQAVSRFTIDVASVWLDAGYYTTPKPLKAFWMLKNWFMPIGGRCLLTGFQFEPEEEVCSVPEALLRHVRHFVIWVDAAEVDHVY